MLKAQLSVIVLQSLRGQLLVVIGTYAFTIEEVPHELCTMRMISFC